MGSSIDDRAAERDDGSQPLLAIVSSRCAHCEYELSELASHTNEPSAVRLVLASVRLTNSGERCSRENASVTTGAEKHFITRRVSNREPERRDVTQHTIAGMPYIDDSTMDT